MNKTYSVFSCHRTPAPVDVTLPSGAQAVAMVDSLEVQLVPADGASGTVKLVFADPAEIATAEALYVPGATITAAFTGA